MMQSGAALVVVMLSAALPAMTMSLAPTASPPPLSPITPGVISPAVLSEREWLHPGRCAVLIRLCELSTGSTMPWACDVPQVSGGGAVRSGRDPGLGTVEEWPRCGCVIAMKVGGARPIA